MIAPDFSLPDQDGKIHRLADYRGQWVVVYFYPKDDTPGCTIEACNFRDNMSRLTEAGIVIFGISKDSVKSHRKFADKFSLPFTLLSDTATDTIKAYDAWHPKKFMGREYFGVTRRSFLINPKGEIVKTYDAVNVETHAEEIVADVKSLS